MRYRMLVVSSIMAVLMMAGAVELVAPKEGQGKKGKETQQSGSSMSEKKVAEPSDCSNIRSGTAGSVAESAAQKDCESSRHLGAGSGTSSGTGSGKMPPSGGPR